ncbi:uncharacterized protein [Magallana gigas]|uniref:uncharacterized protein isoform X4 n=1 Tax=Magallana gigas TaxID=29159 RepID=UPI0033405A31
MHQRIFHIRNGVVNSIGDTKYADNLCFHEKSQGNLDETTTATRYEMRSAEKKWNHRASVPKPRTKKKIRTILVPAFKAPRSDDPRMKKIAEMFLAPIFKNSKQNVDSEDLSKRQTSEATESLEGDKKFAYSKLTDGPACDVYEKQNFKMSDDWYRLRDRQRADFNFNLREDMTKSTKDERIHWMLDAVSSDQTTNESPKQTTGQSTNHSIQVLKGLVHTGLCYDVKVIVVSKYLRIKFNILI